MASAAGGAKPRVRAQSLGASINASFTILFPAVVETRPGAQSTEGLKRYVTAGLYTDAATAGGAGRLRASLDLEQRMVRIVGRFARSQSGATAVEYALLCMCIVLGIVVAVAFTGTQLNNTYAEIGSSFK